MLSRRSFPVFCQRLRDRLRGNDFLVFLLLFIVLIIAMLAIIIPAHAENAAGPLAAYFPILPLDAGPDQPPSLLPVASNHPLGEAHDGLTRAIIVIHDFSRDAGRDAALVAALAGQQNASTMIMAPQFMLDSDTVRFADQLPDAGRSFARWSIGGWAIGDDSLPAPGQKPISSFTALDLLLMYLSDRASFPDMRQITIVGHGEGGDFVQRYAAAGQAPDILAQQGLPVHFVVADASSYLYPNSIRPRANRQGFSPPDDGICKDYDNWPYGIQNLNPYARHAGANAIKMRFASRQVAYLVGEGAGRNDPAPDGSCAALLQGAGRPARAINYATYSGLLYGEAAEQHQNLTVVPGAGYDAAALYGSKCGMSLLFGDGNCAPSLAASAMP